MTTTSSTAQTSRRLATVETITEIRDIPDADLIVCARVRGWDVVVKRGEFTVGDPCVYFEVDSMLDVTDSRFVFLAPRGVRTDVDGRSGHVLKTAKLRGQYSQGLALPLTAFPELAGAAVGDDVTAALGVVKWDPPLPASLSGKVRGLRPAWIPMTDEERVQNISAVLAVRDAEWVATEKIDGTSTTFYVNPDNAEDGGYGVCSRNLDLLESDTNTMWCLARELDIHARLEGEFPGHPVCVQGEVYGDSVQGNPLKVRGQRFAVFTLRVGAVEVPRGEWPQWLLDLSVPTHDFPFPATLDEALAQVETLKSKISPNRAAEGVVWRAADRAQVTLPDGQVVRASFKAISNRYLLKNDR